MADHLSKRGGIWYYLRRVPPQYAKLDKRTFARQSTAIRVADDPRGVRAGSLARAINSETESYWRTLSSGKHTEAKRRYDEARALAKKLGFSYMPAAQLAATASLEELVARAEKIAAMNAVKDAKVVDALLGAAPPPPILLSNLVQTYEDIIRTDIREFSKNQLRKWRNPKLRAVGNLIAVVGDKAINELTREDALDFREWWQDRVMTQDLDNITANKDMGRLSAMIEAINLKLRLGLDKVFSGLRLALGDEQKREAFEPAFVQRKFLNGKSLAALNDEARNVILVMIETGMRPSEIVNLSENTIVLGGKIPHVMVRPEGRVMKTDPSRREIPLVGVALEAAKAQPKGFPRYHDKSDSLSGTINKFLDEHDLRPTPQHTLYSLRHTFEDRLTAVEAPEKMIANLMGHKFARPRYGQGPSLSQKHRWLSRIAFKR